MSDHLPSLELRLVAFTALAPLLAWVLRLIRQQRLSLGDSLLWLSTTVAALVVTAFPGLLVRAARLLGFEVPSNALFTAGFLYLALNVLSVTLGVSACTARVRRLAQECALLRAEVAALRDRGDGEEPGPGPDAPR